ncbi:MAG: hypothetical protein GKR95_07725 [Gammaproteobacteria bacterium]|nr:hypothetical protein [Gammaproteobacteria bacterium]
MISASGALVLIAGLGSVIGPILIAVIVDQFGIDGFFWSMGMVHLLTTLFAFYRMTKRASMPLEKQGITTPTAMHSSSSAIESIQKHAQNEA